MTFPDFQSRALTAEAQVKRLCLELSRLQSACRRKDEALARLGSMEAFTYGRVIRPTQDAELLARIKFARAALNLEVAS